MAFAQEISHRTFGSLAALALAAFLFSPSAFAQSGNSDAETASTPALTVGQLARSYRVYQRDMQTLQDLSFTDESELDDANELIMSYDPPELTRGWYAYNGIVAARSPGFMAMVRERSRNGGTDSFLAQAGQNPSYLWSISTETAALDRVLNGIRNDTRDATAVGEVLSSRAYAYMDRRYGTRLPAGAAPNAAAIRRAERNAVELNPIEANMIVPYRAQNVMQRVLEIAAQLSVDRGGNRTNAAGLIYAHEETNRCLRWAQLNLAQCLAAVRGPAEEAYCTGRHGVNEVAECWSWMVEAPADLEVSQGQ